MKHEFKIIYTFDDEKPTSAVANTRILLDDNPIGLVQNLVFKIGVDNIFTPPEITIDFPDENYFSYCSKEIQNTMINWIILFQKIGIKSNMTEKLKKYINLKAFW